MTRARFLSPLRLAAAVLVGFGAWSNAGTAHALLHGFNVSPSSGPAGTTVTVSGTGCSPGLIVNAQDYVTVAAVTVPPITLNIPVASNGSWSKSFTVPANNPALPVAITALCFTNGLPSLVTLYTPQTFTVTASSPPSTQPSPTTQPPDDTSNDPGTPPPGDGGDGGDVGSGGGSGGDDNGGSNGGDSSNGGGGSGGGGNGGGSGGGNNGGGGNGNDGGDGGTGNGGGSGGGSVAIDPVTGPPTGSSGGAGGTDAGGSSAAGNSASGARITGAALDAPELAAAHHKRGPRWLSWLALMLLAVAIAGSLALYTWLRRTHHAPAVEGEPES